MGPLKGAPIPPRPGDTTEEAERVQVQLLRAAPVSTRLAKAFGLSATVLGLARRSLARSRPAASQPELDLWFAEVHYGAELATGLRARLERDGPRAE